jgi:hypothetical protein
MSRRSSIGRYFMSRYTNKYDYSYFTEYNSSGASYSFCYISMSTQVVSQTNSFMFSSHIFFPSKYSYYSLGICSVIK